MSVTNKQKLKQFGKSTTNRRFGYLILSDYGNIGGFFTDKEIAEEHFEKHFKDEKGFYIFPCVGKFKGHFFM